MAIHINIYLLYLKLKLELQNCFHEDWRGTFIIQRKKGWCVCVAQLIQKENA